MFDDKNRFRNTDRETGPGGLTLAPMIDVVFLLLIFFMVSTTFVVRPGLDLQLPTAQSQTDVSAEKWVISISPDGTYYLNRETVTLDKLSERLMASPKPVTVRADRTVPHGLVVNVLDTVQQSGIDSVSVSTREPNSE
jgi:biopolymer transport protein ExbD